MSPPDAPPAAVVYALLLGSAVLSGVGDIFIFKWAKAGHWGWMAAGLATWAVGLLLMGLFFRWAAVSFSVAVVLLVVVHLLVDVTWDVAVAGTRPTVAEWVGGILAVVAVLLLQFGGRTSPPG
jgi:hypothetical protein